MRTLDWLCTLLYPLPNAARCRSDVTIASQPNVGADAVIYCHLPASHGLDSFKGTSHAPEHIIRNDRTMASILIVPSIGRRLSVFTAPTSQFRPLGVLRRRDQACIFTAFACRKAGMSALLHTPGHLISQAKHSRGRGRAFGSPHPPSFCHVLALFGSAATHPNVIGASDRDSKPTSERPASEPLQRLNACLKLGS